MKSVLHVLLLLTPFKSNAYQGADTPEEVLKAGALYCKCDMVHPRIPSPTMADATSAEVGHGIGVYDESATCGTNKVHKVVGLWVPSFLPAMGNTLSFIRLALIEFLDNLHIFQILQARSQRPPELPNPNPAAHSGPTSPPPSPLTFLSS
ncbi:hypothetical protein BDR03DRAFT_1009080 [Suillus americanus]|nr:hypothetical protein BDR03DRAFT_1009080 [Suillus americanus]